MATKTEPRGTEVVAGTFDQAVRAFNDALKAGVQIQEEVGRFWTGTLDQTVPVGDWQKRSQAILTNAIPVAQKGAEEWLKVVEQNYARSMRLFKKTFDTDSADVKDLRERSQKLWEESLELVRDNAQATMQANLKMLEAWTGLMQKNVNGAKKAVAMK